MKSLKILLIILGITAFTSMGNVFAYYPIQSLAGMRVPAHNGSVSTSIKNVPEYAVGSDQIVNNVSISPSGDTLDIRVRKYNANNAVVKNGAWKILKTGSKTVLSSGDLDFNFDGSRIQVQIDSRWFYTDNTIINSGMWAYE